jgi:hypothetical protein
MATQTSVTVIDDITGEPGAETVTFGLDGGWYEVDLAPANREKLYSSLADFVANARKVASEKRKVSKVGPIQSGSGSAKRDRVQTKAIRDWARSNGHQVSDRGRIPDYIQKAYDNNRDVAALQARYEARGLASVG